MASSWVERRISQWTLLDKIIITGLKKNFHTYEKTIWIVPNSSFYKEKLQFARLWSKCHSLVIEKFSLSDLKNACMQFKNRLFRPPQIWRFATDIADLLTLCYTLPHRHPATGVSVDKPNIFNALHTITDTYAKNRRTSFCQRQRYRWKATLSIHYITTPDFVVELRSGVVVLLCIKSFRSYRTFKKGKESAYLKLLRLFHTRIRVQGLHR